MYFNFFVSTLIAFSVLYRSCRLLLLQRLAFAYLVLSALSHSSITILTPYHSFHILMHPILSCVNWASLIYPSIYSTICTCQAPDYLELLKAQSIHLRSTSIHLLTFQTILLHITQYTSGNVAVWTHRSVSLQFCCWFCIYCWSIICSL